MYALTIVLLYYLCTLVFMMTNFKTWITRDTRFSETLTFQHATYIFRQAKSATATLITGKSKQGKVIIAEVIESTQKDLGENYNFDNLAGKRERERVEHYKIPGYWNLC